MTSELKPYAYAYIGKDGQPDGDRFGIHPLTEGDLKAGYSQIPLYTRAAPDVPELETVAFAEQFPDGTFEVVQVHKGRHCTTPLVTRQNAEEVIENLKNNIAAKNRLIQSLIDFDSEEVKRLEADNAAKDAQIAELEAKLETANALVTCCCGSLVNDHDMGSGHSPVDQYHYAMVQLEADNKRLREALESIADWHDGGKEYGQWSIKMFARAALEQLKDSLK